MIKYLFDMSFYKVGFGGKKKMEAFIGYADIDEAIEMLKKWKEFYPEETLRKEEYGKK